MLKQEEVQEAITSTQGPSLHHASGADARDVSSSVCTLHYSDLCFGSRTSSVNRYIEVMPFSQGFKIVVSGFVARRNHLYNAHLQHFVPTLHFTGLQSLIAIDQSSRPSKTFCPCRLIDKFPHRRDAMSFTRTIALNLR